jgi:hypothetical protein
MSVPGFPTFIRSQSRALLGLLVASLGVTILRPASTLGATPAGCIGDCNGDGSVTVDELLTLTSIALGKAVVASCDAGDVSNDGHITVDEIVKSMNAALSPCTQTGGMLSIARRAAGQIQTSTAAILSVTDVVSLLLGPLSVAEGPAAASRLQGPLSVGEGSGAADLSLTCGGGGTVALACDPSPSVPPGPPTYTLTMSQCVVFRGANATVTFDGAVVATAPGTDVCNTGLPIAPALDAMIERLTVSAHGPQTTTMATMTGTQASVALSGSDPDCPYSEATLHITGTMDLVSTGADGTSRSTRGVFNGATMVTDVEQYGDLCSVDIYKTTIDGVVDFSDDGGSFSQTYTGFALHDDRTSGNDIVNLSGGIASECFGTPLAFATPIAQQIVSRDPCPRGGEVTVSYNNRTDLLRYSDVPSANVQIDLNEDGSVEETLASCLDPLLYVCPAL